MSDIYPDEASDGTISEREALDNQRYELLQRLADWMEVPMLVLAMVWLALLAGELVWGENRPFSVLGTAIWIIFLLHFAVEFALAPHKPGYLRKNWLTALSLLLPALRVFRIVRVVRLLRVARVGRSLRLLRVISSINRGMGALGDSLQRRGFGYVAALTLLVVFGGAAGMYAFENDRPGALDSYGEALWWTVMIMTTMGSDYWPQTFEGRVLCIFLSLYAFGVFGYVTATLATYFVGREAESRSASPSRLSDLESIERQLISLREEVRSLADRLG